MNVSIAAVLLSVLVVLPALAEGDHASQAGDTQGQSSAHDHSSMAGAHHSEASVGPVGLPAEPGDASQVVKVTLTDEMKIEFNRDLGAIKSGTVIQFLITNIGKIPHEFSIGNREEQQAHGAMMRKMPGMTHSDGNTLTIQPGMTKTLTWNFEGDDVVVFACNIPGHFEAGMFQKSVLKP